MPIYIERPQPSTLKPQDIIDIRKIYDDYPIAEALVRFEAWQHNTLDPNWQLVVARFNDRLLGALWLHTHENQDNIHAICVRKITRGRGVGRRLIDNTVKASKTNQHEIALGHPASTAEAQQILEHLLANPSPFDAIY